ncbi:helix-turn-helix domain-containing protein [Amycolatopsis sp. NPDC049688]|uniref:nSTAND1 domain-containing NTPase n=1 Tax=Amycolatopsis sp. NPDC049688 TaxID=3154733 RepID=UPI003449BBEC
MVRQERPLDVGDDPLLQFAAKLRLLRQKSGSPPYRELARRAHYSSTTLSDAAGGRKLPTLAVTLAYVTACGGNPAEWEPYWREVASLLAEDTAEIGKPGSHAPTEADSPYVGLEPFQPQDAHRFFGRELLTDELVYRVLHHRFLAVFGASGAGKSSVLRAGLIARIQAETDWPVVLMTPGTDPVTRYESALADLTDADANDDSVLVVDQFEEVFTLCQDAAERAAFIDALIRATHASDARLRIVLGIRADFYPHCADFPRLAEAMRDRQLLVGAMTPDELRRAIVQPAVSVNHVVESSLLAAVLTDSAGQAGILPLVSHAMLVTWQHRRGHTLTLSAYQASGGIQHALAQTAEKVYSAFDEHQRVAAKGLFLRLTALGERTEDTKRRIFLDELGEPGTSPLAEVLAELTAARLVHLDENSVEITHEALIKRWPRLRDWLAEDREGLQVHRHLTHAADSWEAIGREPGSLYRGSRLALASDWAAHNGTMLTARERTFLDTSTAHEARERTTVLRRARQLRLLASGLVLLLLATIGIAIIAMTERHTARQERQIAVSRELAVRANSGPPSRASLILAAEAFRQFPGSEARGALLSITQQSAIATYFDHPKSLLGLAYSPDGRTLAVAGADNTVRLRDVPGHRETAVLTGHAAAVFGVAFSPDGGTLASVANDRTLKLWDVANRREIATLTGHTAPLNGVALSPDGHLAVTSSNDRTVRLWDVAARREIATLTGHTGAVYGVAFSPDGRTVASAGEDHTVKLWDVAAHREIATLAGHTAGAEQVAFSPDGHLLASSGDDFTVRLWDVGSRTEVATLSGHSAEVFGVAFSRDGSSLATASVDATVRIWDVPRRRQTAVLTGRTSSQFGVAFSPDGRTVAATGTDGTLTMWALSPAVLAPSPAAHQRVVRFSPDGRTLATGGEDGVVRLWDPAGRRVLATFAAGTDQVNDIAFSPDGRTLAIAGRDGEVRLWDARTQREIRQFTGYKHPVFGVAFSPDGRTLATTSGGDAGRAVQLWDVVEGRPAGSLEGHTGLVYAVKFSPDGQTLASGSQDGTIRLWDAATRRATATLTGHTTNVTSVSFSPDGKTLASASIDHTVKLWDLSGDRPPATLSGHEGGVTDVAFGPGGTVVSAGQDHTIRLWESSALRPLAVLAAHTDAVNKIAFGPDGHTLASAAADGTARLWELDPARALADVCRTLGPVTRDEWAALLPDLPYTPPCR